jgi:AcrR family transcriptional regulator
VTKKPDIKTNAPMPPVPKVHGNVKVRKEAWLEAAKQALIEESIGSVKVDRLAKRLNITRGSFYHYFKNAKALLDELLEYWRLNNRFITDDMDLSSPESARLALIHTADELVHEQHFDPQFDLAIREWARISKPVASVVSATDDNRLRELRAIFQAMGYPIVKARIRAKIFYMHQIGYYSLGMAETTQEREENIEHYLEVLGGDLFLEQDLAA